MERKKLFNHRLIVTSGLLIAGLVTASAAEAGDRHRNHRRDDARLAEAREAVRDARDYDRRLDRRGRRIDAHLDVFALFAAATGNYDLAYELDRKGDRIERRLDRRGDRILRDARHDRRHTRRHSRTDNHNARDRRDHDWNRRDRSHRKGWNDRKKHDRKHAHKRPEKRNKQNRKRDSKRGHDKHRNHDSAHRQSDTTDKGLRLHRNLIQNRSFR